MGIGEYSKSSQLAEVLNQRMLEKSGGSNQRLAIMLGMLTRSKTHPVQVLTSQNDRSAYSQTKYKFLLDAPFKISPKCCDIMKKAPAHEYAKISGRLPITAQMAFESRLRTQKWLQNGCNGFNLKIPTSNPMAFWTEQDVLLYIKENSLKIASVYGDIVEDYSGSNQVNNQMSLLDFGIFDLERPSLKTTGCNRTGCVFCGFGCHLEKPQQGRFERLSTTHPKFFDYVMRGGSFNEDGMWQPSNGLGYWFIILWIREHGNINIAAPRLDEYRKKYSDSKAERLLRKGDNYGQTNRG